MPEEKKNRKFPGHSPEYREITDADDPRVTKRKVTMINVQARPTERIGADGDPIFEILKIKKVDFVREDLLDAYVEHARSTNPETGAPFWQSVIVDYDCYNAGPGGYEGQTHVPAGLNHPDAGRTFAAIAPGEDA